MPEVTADDHTLGPAGAPVTVLEYGDYECPFCRGAYRDVHRMLDLYPGSILFAFRNFPIQQLHPHAEQAAEAAEAAAAQGKFWEMYELLLRPLVQPRPRTPWCPRPGAWPEYRAVPAGGRRPRLRRQDRG